ncbi:hypothetical protein B0J13DRAFT_644218 [Dactylonectria estremocensis]|uniref:Chitin-binding type-1 domain-containing protein n=1 Tax=Dactylonectria estremocensis TaxID=1079267 RepID=A0A9P9FES6_9HYPO|nr:hypothetical protein B0J13DRAFT_644218 [Dactylonectria estremocensis]
MTLYKISLLSIPVLASLARGFVIEDRGCIDNGCEDGSCCLANGNLGVCGTGAECGVGCVNGPCEPSDWKSISCDVPGNPELSGSERWSSALAQYAFDKSVQSWAKDSGNDIFSEINFRRDTQLTFSQYCGSLVDRNGCDQFTTCGTTDGPAGYLIINSFVAINNVLWNWYDQIDRSANDIVREVASFGEVFSPIPEEGLGLVLILDMITLGYAAIAAPMWKLVFKKMNLIKDGDNFGTVEGLTKDLTSTGATITKDATRAGTPLNTDNTLEARVGAMVKSWHDAIDQVNTQLFSGSIGFNNNILLADLVSDGKMADASLNLLSAQEIDTQVKRAMYSQLIPYAWQVGVSNINHYIDGMGYYLMGTWGEKNCLDDLNLASWDCRDFEAPPGVGELDGTKWGGVTEEDIVMAAYNTWNTNGRTNINRPEEADIGASSEVLKQIAEVDIRGAGLNWLPVCNPNEAHDNWQKATNGGDRSAHYPCT